MSRQLWAGATPMAEVRAGDLLAALWWLTSFRQQPPTTAAAGGFCLIADEYGLSIAASDGTVLLVRTVPAGSLTPGVVTIPGSFLETFQTQFVTDPDDGLELALSADQDRLLVLDVDEPNRRMAQPTCPSQDHIDLYNNIVAGDPARSTTLIAHGNVLRDAARRAAAHGGVAVLAGTPHHLIMVDSAGPQQIPAMTDVPFRIEVESEVLARGVDAIRAATAPNQPEVTLGFAEERGVVEFRSGADDSPHLGTATVYVPVGADPAPHPWAPTQAPQDAQVFLPRPPEDADDILAEIQALPGFEAVKQQARLVKHMVEANQHRVARGLSPDAVLTPMVFAGPPGTGKSYAAQLLARHYKALGVLTDDTVTEVNRITLMDAQMRGGQAPTAEALFDSATGGVLFIDDADDLIKDPDDPVVHIVVQALLDALSARGSQFLCIVSGTQEGIRKFLAFRSELRTTFTRTLTFPHFSPEELVAIAQVAVKSTDNTLDSGALAKLRARLDEHAQYGGMQGPEWTGARIIEPFLIAAITQRNTRLANEGTPASEEGMVTITDVDVSGAADELSLGKVAGAAEILDDVMADVDALVGQAPFKQKVRQLVDQALFNKRLTEQGGVPGAALVPNLVFTGPPGTGKTTAARLIGRLYRALELLRSSDVVEVSSADLIGQWVGETEDRTKQRFAEAMGGVFFLDEAPQLAQDDRGFGARAIGALIPLIENNRGRVAVIAAGYSDGMTTFLGVDAGMPSRFDATIEFAPYSAQELVEIAEGLVARSQRVLDPEARELLTERLVAAERAGLFAAKTWGNARMMRKVVEQAGLELASRLNSAESFDATALTTFVESDIDRALTAVGIGGDNSDTEDRAAILAELDAIVGQPQLKEQVREVLAAANAASQRLARGLDSRSQPLDHLCFVGPPGTGKTTVARLMGRLYKSVGLLPTSNVKEVVASDLVVGYVRQTGPNTDRIVDQALGGVLFIDEAYTLVQGGSEDFGQEAISALLPRLSHPSDRFLAIAAGYPEQMEQFLASNPGLKRRFSRQIEFVPYDAAELTEIADRYAAKNAESIDPDAHAHLADRLAAAEAAGLFAAADWGNAGSVIKVVDHARKRRDARIFNQDVADSDYVTLREADMKEACDLADFPAVAPSAVAPSAVTGQQSAPETHPSPPAEPPTAPITAAPPVNTSDRDAMRRAMSQFVGEAVQSLAPGAERGRAVAPGPELAQLGVVEVYWQGGSGMGVQFRTVRGSKTDFLFYLAGGSNGKLPAEFWWAKGTRSAHVHDLASDAPHHTLVQWQESGDSLAGFVLATMRKHREAHE